MAYTVGVSSGYWSIKKDPGLLGMHMKAQWCIKAGVRHTQVDIESITELQEPDIKNKMERTKKMGITFGCHSEAKAYGGMDTMLSGLGMDSAQFGNMMNFQLVTPGMAAWGMTIYFIGGFVSSIFLARRRQLT